ncbi:phosphatidylinositol 3 and 4-kinase-domain-containing protein [Pilobolus umbonatus]|nr:phosphatidylinositol 3 and 4-kinase-domain-containing protein [Pilobolus umbonatus]
MFGRQHTSSAGQYSRLDQYDEDEDIHHQEILLHHPNSVLVANHHNQCNIVPPLSLPTLSKPHHSPPHSPRASFSAATALPDTTRHFFQTKLPIVFRKDMGSAASFSSLPAVIIADLQNGDIPEYKAGKKMTQDLEGANCNDQGWYIVHSRRYKGKHGVGEARHKSTGRRSKSRSSSVVDMALVDEEIDPSDQVTCSVFVPWRPDQHHEHTMVTPSLFHNVSEEPEDIDRNFDDPIPETRDNFEKIVESVRTAIRDNIQPTRISQGSSGSYFCRNRAGEIVGVFKPKNEEPYGSLNPKWTKWIHRHLFPCFFGRSCLIPNLGYLSEAAASLIDRKLGTMVVPFTDVIQLASPSFHYDYLDRRSSPQKLPQKIGSFQCFLTNYTDATVFFRDHPLLLSEYSGSLSRKSVWGGCLGRNEDDHEEDAMMMSNGVQVEGMDDYKRLHDMDPIHPTEEDSDQTHVPHHPYYTHASHISVTTTQSARPSTPSTSKPPPKNQASIEKPFRWTNKLLRQFKREFEQLVILDYLIRNTDRGLDNWMIKYCDGRPASHSHQHTNSSSSSSIDTATTPPHTNNNNTTKHTSSRHSHIHVAAIDNGLAFPYKHPDQWRSYPYGWTAMPDHLVNQPFSEATRKQFLPMLSDPLWWRDTVREMRSLFELDDDFDERMFQKQMQVLKGQGYNIVRVLSNPAATPIDLVTMERVVVKQKEVLIEYDERVLQTRDLHLHNIYTNTNTTTLDISDALNSPQKGRRLRTQRSTSFDVISTASQFHQVEPPISSAPGKVMGGLSIDMGRGRLFGKKKKNKKQLNKYRAFDSDGDISDGNNSADSEEEEKKLKQVTVIMEAVEIVKSRTYFTCW